MFLITYLSLERFTLLVSVALIKTKIVEEGSVRYASIEKEKVKKREVVWRKKRWGKRRDKNDFKWSIRIVFTNHLFL